MNRIHRFICTLALLMGASGCALISGNSGTKIHLVERNGIDMIAAPAGHVSVLVKDKDSKERTCGGRLPDAIMDGSLGLNLGHTGLGVGTNNTDIALGGRSPAVLIVREVLFRLCEIVINADLDSAAIVELYKDSLPMVLAALKSSTGGTAALAVDGVGVVSGAPATSATNPHNGSTSTGQNPGGLEQQFNQYGSGSWSGYPAAGSASNSALAPSSWSTDFKFPSAGGGFDGSNLNSNQNASSPSTIPAISGAGDTLQPAGSSNAGGDAIRPTIPVAGATDSTGTTTSATQDTKIAPLNEPTLSDPSPAEPSAGPASASPLK